jgi:aminopeptidase N
VTGKDYQWFFDAYFYQAKLPELRRRATATTWC